MAQIESIFWGIIAALGALVIELVVFSMAGAYENQNLNFTFSAIATIPAFIIVAASIEEVFKYIIISRQIEKLSLEKSYVVNALCVGIGFFIVEYWLITQSGVILSMRDTLEIALLHIGTAGIIGYIVATRNPKKFGTLLFSLSATTIFHASYNFLSINRNFFIQYIIFFVLFILVAINLINFFRISSVLARR